jgi:hypothetical protein
MIFLLLHIFAQSKVGGKLAHATGQRGFFGPL